MESHMMFLDCPAYLGGGAARCGLPAEVETRYTVSSTDGPLESAKIRCPRGHWFNGPIESLTVPAADHSCRIRQPAAASDRPERQYPEPPDRRQEKIMTPLVGPLSAYLPIPAPCAATSVNRPVRQR